MFTHIVVPLDGSQLAAHALGYATVLAEHFHASLTLVSVLAPYLAEAYGEDALDVAHSQKRTAHDAALVRAEEVATAYLEGVAAPLRARGLACEVTILHGNPAAAIISCAGEAPGTLIVMSTHGRTGVDRWRLGSVAQHVMRHAAVPTFVVRAREEAVPDAPPVVAEITLTLDGSAFAEQALPVATALADAFGVPLVLLTIVPEMAASTAPEETEFTPAAHGAERGDEAGAAAYLARVAAQITTPTRTVRSVWLRGGDRRPAEAIEEYLAARPAGITVLASHGHGGVLRWVLGSTTEGLMVRWVMRSTAEGMVGGSPQPVLIVRVGKAMAGEVAR
jgi:nucleotide-binding universal stress UspA family protein